MRKFCSVFLCILLIMAFSCPVFATSGDLAITQEIQSPNYPEYSVAMYMVKASGSNLSATWYMDWQGTTYTISDVGGAFQDWEAYAGESYGARKLDDNTFTFTFEGIEADLDGAYIWCVIEDGHNDVTSQAVRMNVGSEIMPPVILEIPAQLTVEQGEEAEIRCIAQGPMDTQLSFLWYETDTGRLEDIRAVNRGTETSDFLLCDTSSVGTRYYVCMVETSEGGQVYSSVVTVTVTEKATEPTKTTNPETKATTSEKQTTVPETQATTPETTAPTEPKDTTPAPQTQPATTTQPTQAPAASQPPVKSHQEEADGGMPWWSLVLIALAGAGAGVGAAVILIRKNQNTK